MSPSEINALCQRVIGFRDLHLPTQRYERDLLADVCNALDGYTKQTRGRDAACADRIELLDLIARACEELRMIEMKDSAAIYDIGLRSAFFR